MKIFLINLKQQDNYPNKKYHLNFNKKKTVDQMNNSNFKMKSQFQKKYYQKHLDKLIMKIRIFLIMKISQIIKYLKFSKNNKMKKIIINYLYNIINIKNMINNMEIQ